MAVFFSFFILFFMDVAVFFWLEELRSFTKLCLALFPGSTQRSADGYFSCNF